jgi:division protein CdvB (Snf7/Vps24/ESCRT-III family)
MKTSKEHADIVVKSIEELIKNISFSHFALYTKSASDMALAQSNIEIYRENIQISLRNAFFAVKEEAKTELLKELDEAGVFLARIIKQIPHE